MEMHFLGITKNGEAAFADFGLRTKPGREYFSASFETVRPVCEEDLDLDQMYKDLIEDLDSEFKYELCERWDCKPSDLADKYRKADEANRHDGLNAIMDFSLFPEVYTVNDEEWGFESGSCGQHDLRKDGMAYVVNREAFDELMGIWSEYHLKPNDMVPDDVKARIEYLYGVFPSYYDFAGEKAVDEFLETYIEKLAYDAGERMDEELRFTPGELEEFAVDPKNDFSRFLSDAKALCSPSLEVVSKEARSLCEERMEAGSAKSERVNEAR